MREGGLMEQAKRDFYLQRFVDLIDVGRCEMSNPDAVNRKVAVGVLGSIYGLLVRRLETTGEEGLSIEMIDDLMYLAVRPYLGQEAALQELSNTAPPSVA